MKVLGFEITRNKEVRKSIPVYGGIQENNYILQNAVTFFSNLLNNSGQSVTPDTAFKLSAFWACVRNISEDVAKVPFTTLKKTGDGNLEEIDHISDYLINVQPSNVNDSFTFRQVLVRNALIYGNGYAYIKRNEKTAEPEALYICDPRYVTVILNDQKLYYIINDPKIGVTGEFTAEDVFHIKGLGDGYVGMSVITYGAESIGCGLAAQTYAASFFASGATLGGVLEIPGVVQDENTAAQIKSQFNNSYKTANGANNGVALLQAGAQFKKISATPNEGQMVEAREFGVADICRWFRMPLSKVQEGSTGSSNLEQLNIEYVTDCLMPWFVRLEKEIERKLYTTNEVRSRKLQAKFIVSELMRGDMKSTSDYISTLFHAGTITQNDARRIIGVNTIKEDYANQLYSPANMIPTYMAEDFWKAKDNSQATSKQPGTGGEPK